MLDKLDTRLDATTRFRGVVSDIADALRKRIPVPGFSADPHYSGRVDLREYEIPAVLHYSLRRGDAAGSHKLSALDAGEKSFEELLAVGEQVAHGDPLTREVMRFDVAANVPDVPVSWFKEHARAQFKRFACEHGKFVLEYSEMGSRRIQTLYFGKRPNCVRIYNKVDEWLNAYEKRYRRARAPEWAKEAGFDGVSAWRRGELSDDAEIPSFESLHGLKPDAVLTRVERQISGNRSIPDNLKHDKFWSVQTAPADWLDDGEGAPDEDSPESKPICTVSALWQRLRITDPDNPRFFDPFKRLQLSPNGLPSETLDPDYFKASDWLTGMGLRSLIERLGKQNAWAYLNKRGNAAYYFKRYAAFLPADPESADPGSYVAGISNDDLLRNYQQSISRQLAA